MNQTEPDANLTNTDKKDIADEEREKMLNEENEKHKDGSAAEATAVTPQSQATDSDVETKRKIPIGGIKMPGFCRMKSKEANKEEGNKSGAEAAGETERGILDAVKRPIVNVLASIRKPKANDGELGGAGAAGLASVETLGEIGDKGGEIGVGDDGMETVRLDGGNEESNPAKNLRKQSPLMLFLSAARRNYIATGVVLIVLLVAIIVISVACVGPRRIMVQPLKDGKYMEAVTGCGPVQGVLEDGGFAFRGIPYALPPVNNLRWRSAELINRIEHCWNGTYLAHNSSNSCWQRDENGIAEGTEDCLYLDVFTPQVRYDTPLPVVVMIGAETLNGGSPGAMQPSAKLARVRDMVFVRPNFRLGIFGFLTAKPLSRANHHLTSGNHGLSDIIAVLKWVQLNIQNFGGNKSSVTIWGHRAGGTLVTCLLTASRQQTKGLFSRAWISSSSAVLPARSLDISERSSEPFLRAIQCSDALCLRNKTAQEVINAEPPSSYSISENTGLPGTGEVSSLDRNRTGKHEWLVIDGVIIQEDAYEYLQRHGSPVQLIMGTTAHSGTPGRFKNPNVTMSSSQIEKIVKESLLGTLGIANEALQRYNSTVTGLAAMTSDIRVVCPMYNFTSTLPQSNISFYVATQPRYGHLADVDSDVAAILGSYTPKTPEEKRHQSAIQQLFNQFVWHNRVIDSAKVVPASESTNYKPDARVTIVIEQDILPRYGYPNCDYWIKKNIVPKYARVD